MLMKTAAAFLMAEVFVQNAFAAGVAPDAKTMKKIETSLKASGGMVFPVGTKLTSKYFTGPVYAAPVGGQKDNIGATNVTFAPGTINWWHTHTGACQVLISVSGRGYYQVWGEEPKEVKAGDTVSIPAGVKHWHGAAKDSWYQHIAVKIPSETVWLEPVDPKIYEVLK